MGNIVIGKNIAPPAIPSDIITNNHHQFINDDSAIVVGEPLMIYDNNNIQQQQHVQCKYNYIIAGCFKSNLFFLSD